MGENAPNEGTNDMTAIGNPTAALRACIDAMTPSKSQEETAACILAEKALRGQPFPAASLETAACLWEAVCEMEQNGDTRSADSDLEERGEMIRAAREAMGSSALRITVIGWTARVDAAWLEAQDTYDFPFDWEFVPGWIARNIDWSNPHCPTVRAVPLPEPESDPLNIIADGATLLDTVDDTSRDGGKLFLHLADGRVIRVTAEVVGGDSAPVWPCPYCDGSKAMGHGSACEMQSVGA